MMHVAQQRAGLSLPLPQDTTVDEGKRQYEISWAGEARPPRFPDGKRVLMDHQEVSR